MGMRESDVGRNIAAVGAQSVVHVLSNTAFFLRIADIKFQLMYQHCRPVRAAMDSASSIVKITWVPTRPFTSSDALFPRLFPKLVYLHRAGRRRGHVSRMCDSLGSLAPKRAPGTYPYLSPTWGSTVALPGEIHYGVPYWSSPDCRHDEGVLILSYCHGCRSSSLSPERGSNFRDGFGMAGYSCAGLYST
jgi:hypothetical protein